MTAPNKIDSNVTGLAFAEETTPGVLPGTPIWRALEPNSYADFGGDITTSARAPINASRQRQKGTITDMTATLGFNHDFLQNALTRLIQSFFFAAAREKSDTQTLAGVTVAVASATTTTYTAAAGFTHKAKDLVLASGFTNAGNNGLKLLSLATATTLTTTGLTAEAAPPAAARVRTVGVEFASADINVVLVGTTAVTLASTVYDFTTLGLTLGEWVYVGGDATATHFVNNAPGFARVSGIAAHVLSFDDTTWTPVNETGTGLTIRMFFGTVIRNEKTPALIVQKSNQFERSLGNDGVGTQTEYVLGAVGNDLTLTIPQASKLSADLAFVGFDAEQRTGTTGPKAGTRVPVVQEDAYNTTSDVVRLRLAVVDPTKINNAALVGYVTEGKLTVGNGVTPDKAIGTLGGFDVSAGDFTVGGSLTAYFTSVAAVAAVRANSDICFNAIVAAQNAGFVFDAPLLSIAGGRATVEKDKPIMLPLTNSAFESPNGYTLMYCNFGYLPTVAMPV